MIMTEKMEPPKTQCFRGVGVPGALRHRIYCKDIGSDVGDAAKAAYTNCVLIAPTRDTKSNPLRVALASPAGFEPTAFRLGALKKPDK